MLSRRRIVWFGHDCCFSFHHVVFPRRSTFAPSSLVAFSNSSDGGANSLAMRSKVNFPTILYSNAGRIPALPAAHEMVRATMHALHSRAPAHSAPPVYFVLHMHPDDDDPHRSMCATPIRCGAIPREIREVEAGGVFGEYTGRIMPPDAGQRGPN